MQTTINIAQSEEPLSRNNFVFQHRVWIIQHCILAIIAALTVALLLETLNLGPFSKGSIDPNMEFQPTAQGSIRPEAKPIFSSSHFILPPATDTP